VIEENTNNKTNKHFKKKTKKQANKQTSNQTNKKHTIHLRLFHFSMVRWDGQQDLFNGRWNHIALKWHNTTSMSLYINGKLNKTNTVTPENKYLEKKVRFTLGQEQDDYSIGKYDPIQTFVGNITGFNMWKRALNDSQILRLSNGCPSNHVGNLIKWSDVVAKRSSSVGLICTSTCN